MNISNIDNLKEALAQIATDKETVITNTIWRNHRGISDVNQSSQELKRLVEAGFLRVEGKKRGTKYFLV